MNDYVMRRPDQSFDGTANLLVASSSCSHYLCSPRLKVPLTRCSVNTNFLSFDLPLPLDESSADDIHNGNSFDVVQQQDENFNESSFVSFLGESSEDSFAVKDCSELEASVVQDSSPCSDHNCTKFSHNVGEDCCAGHSQLSSDTSGTSPHGQHQQDDATLAASSLAQLSLSLDQEHAESSVLQPCVSGSSSSPPEELLPCSGHHSVSLETCPVTEPSQFPRKTVRSYTVADSEGSQYCFPRPGPSCLALKHAVLSLNRLDDFTKEKIGEGFFSEVYKVTHNVTGAVMVLKVNTMTQNRPNVLREVQLINRLHHPNVVRFMGVCVDNGQLHSLTEYCEGGSLDQLIQNLSKPLPWSQRISFSLDIARGMNYVHGAGYIHRDLTSKNVLLRVESGYNKLTAVVADFGLAIKIPRRITLSDNSVRCQKLPTAGTPYWMAPECLNDECYDEQADVFSFGIIMCEMIARIDADPDSMPRTHNFGLDYLRFSELCPVDCPTDFLQVAFGCCLMDPKSRYTFSDTIQCFRQVLRSLINCGFCQNSESSDFCVDAISIRRSHSDVVLSEFSENSDDFQMWSPITALKAVPSSRMLAHNIAAGDPFYRPGTEFVNPFDLHDRYRGCRKIFVSRKFSEATPRSVKGRSIVSFPPHCPRSVLLASKSSHPVDSKETRSLPGSPSLLRRAMLINDTLSPAPSPRKASCATERLDAVAADDDLTFSDSEIVSKVPHGRSGSRTLLGADFADCLRSGSVSSRGSDCFSPCRRLTAQDFLESDKKWIKDRESRRRKSNFSFGGCSSSDEAASSCEECYQMPSPKRNSSSGSFVRLSPPRQDSTELTIRDSSFKDILLEGVSSSDEAPPRDCVNALHAATECDSDYIKLCYDNSDLNYPFKEACSTQNDVNNYSMYCSRRLRQNCNIF